MNPLQFSLCIVLFKCTVKFGGCILLWVVWGRTRQATPPSPHHQSIVQRSALWGNQKGYSLSSLLWHLKNTPRYVIFSKLRQISLTMPTTWPLSGYKWSRLVRMKCQNFLFSTLPHDLWVWHDTWEINSDRKRSGCWTLDQWDGSHPLTILPKRCPLAEWVMEGSPIRHVVALQEWNTLYLSLHTWMLLFQVLQCELCTPQYL